MRKKMNTFWTRDNPERFSLQMQNKIKFIRIHKVQRNDKITKFLTSVHQKWRIGTMKNSSCVVTVF